MEPSKKLDGQLDGEKTSNDAGVALIGGDFMFGSELKALKRHPRFDNPIDRRTLRLLAARAYIPAPFSIYQRLFKLEPAAS